MPLDLTYNQFPQTHSYKSFTLPLDPATPDATLQALPGLFQKLLEGTYACR